MLDMTCERKLSKSPKIKKTERRLLLAPVKIQSFHFNINLPTISPCQHPWRQAKIRRGLNSPPGMAYNSVKPQGVVTSQINRFPGSSRALQNNGSSIQGMLEIQEISLSKRRRKKFKRSRPNKTSSWKVQWLKNIKTYHLGIRLFDVLVTFFFNDKCNLCNL